MASSSRALVLVPWHIGSADDVTRAAAAAARDLRLFLAEDPEETKRVFIENLRVDCAEKEFLKIPASENERFLEDVGARLNGEDVGLISSSGIPCFLDPGAWLVRRLRALDVPIRALAGPSILSTMLSLSGLEWAQAQHVGTFAFYLEGRSRRELLRAVRRADPIFIFLRADRFRECLEHIGPAVGERLVSAFLDLTKRPLADYPYADRVSTMSVGDWLKDSSVRWDRVSDVSLMVHPRQRRLPGSASRAPRG
ncbi:MAG TPA: SAM-dependent methyltransferase [Elusimicrobiota bacterium]|nr:SAM-dependent methyltransferase [Elusimicrobiota bacterium]